MLNPINNRTTQKIPKYGAVTIALLASPALMAQAQTGQTSVSSNSADEEVYYMSPFEVNSDSNYGYAATSSLAGTRINTGLEDIGALITVVTREFLKDTEAVNNQILLTCTTNTKSATRRATKSTTVAAAWNRKGSDAPPLTPTRASAA
jgi:hypothetical protein